MLPTRHRPDIHEDHTSTIDPLETCRYPLEEGSAAGTAPTGKASQAAQPAGKHGA